MFFDNRKQEKILKTKIAEKQQLYKRVFDSPEGQLVMEDLAKRCFSGHTTYSDNHGQMGFNEGRRSIYCYIKDLIDKDLTQILEEII